MCLGYLGSSFTFGHIYKVWEIIEYWRKQLSYIDYFYPIHQKLLKAPVPRLLNT